MDFFELIKKRHSVRKFQEKEISEADLQKILEAANRAPSAGNLQSYNIVVVNDSELRKKIQNTCTSKFQHANLIQNVSVILIFFADPDLSSSKYAERGAERYCIQDATIACAYTQLAAESLGISSLWIGSFDDKKISEVLNAPTNLIPVVILLLGYPDGKPRITERKELKDLIKTDKF